MTTDSPAGCDDGQAPVARLITVGNPPIASVPAGSLAEPALPDARFSYAQPAHGDAARQVDGGLPDPVDPYLVDPHQIDEAGADLAGGAAGAGAGGSDSAAVDNAGPIPVWPHVGSLTEGRRPDPASATPSGSDDWSSPTPDTDPRPVSSVTSWSEEYLSRSWTWLRGLGRPLPRWLLLAALPLLAVGVPVSYLATTQLRDPVPPGGRMVHVIGEVSVLEPDAPTRFTGQICATVGGFTDIRQQAEVVVTNDADLPTRFAYLQIGLGGEGTNACVFRFEVDVPAGASHYWFTVAGRKTDGAVGADKLNQIVRLRLGQR